MKYKTISDILDDKELSHMVQARALSNYLGATKRYKTMPMSITENETKEQYAMYYVNKELK